MKKQLPKTSYAIILLAVVVLVVIALWWLSRGSNAAGGNTDIALKSSSNTSAVYDKKRANRQLASLQKQFMQVQHKSKDPRPLIGRIRSYVTAYSDKADGWVLLSQVLIYHDKPQAAYAALVQAAKLKPDKASLQALAGTMAVQVNKPKLAEKYYSRAVQLKPAEGKYRLLLASVQIKLKHYAAAHTTLQEALTIDSSLYKAHAQLASLYEQQGKINLALKQIRQAIAITPKNKKKDLLFFTKRRAKLLNKANHPQAALSVLRDLAIEQRYKVGALKIAAQSWVMLGKPDQAAGEYEQARVLYPVNKTILARAIYYHILAGQLDKAQADIKDFKNISPYDPAIATLQKQLDKKKLKMQG